MSTASALSSDQIVLIDEQQAPTTVALALRVLAACELDDAFTGQVMVRTVNGQYAISPMVDPWNCVAPEEIVMATEEQIVSRQAGRINYPAAVNNLGILRRPLVHAAVHLHGSSATVLGALGQEILPFSQEACVFFERQSIVADRFDYDPGRPAWLHDEIGEAAVLLIRNHGFIVQGETLAEAVALAIQFEACAKQQLQLLSIDAPYTLIPADAARTLRMANGTPVAMQLWYSSILRSVMMEVDG